MDREAQGVEQRGENGPPFTLAALFGAIAAAASWALLFLLTCGSPLSPAMVALVLVAMSVALHYPLRRRPGAWVIASLSAGLIANAALCVAFLLADFG